MNLITKRIRGMQDLLPDSSNEWVAMEQIIKKEALLYGFREIRTPVLENAELFQRSSGEESDVVQKEMYTFDDKGGRSVSLRPEGTAGVVRAVLENGLHNGVLPLKLMYTVSCYRYEKPQSGRLREFFQFGTEIFGVDSPLADAELITLGDAIFKRLNIKNMSLEINSIGCRECRKNYIASIKEYFKNQKHNLCDTCLSRLEKNPMRIFDCKCEECKKICKNAPVILDYICDECKNHFETLKSSLSDAGIEYTVNPRIVRGLDYYSRTVFEFIYNSADGPLTACGGGRYDGLSEDLGGPSLPAIGFGMGMERIAMIMADQGITCGSNSVPDLFIICAGDSERGFASRLCRRLRENSIFAQVDISGKKVKNQMKYANKIGAKRTIVIGSNEINSGEAILHNMQSGEDIKISLGENFVGDFSKILMN